MAPVKSPGAMCGNTAMHANGKVLTCRRPVTHNGDCLAYVLDSDRLSEVQVCIWNPDDAQTVVVDDPVGFFMAHINEYSSFPHCDLHSGWDWCDCIEWYVRLELDGARGFEAGETVAIPLFPNSHLWVNAQMHTVLNHDNVLSVSIEGHTNLIDLGFIMRGDGRNTIRSTFLDYLRSRLDNPAYKCAATVHRPTRNQGERQKMMELASVLTTGFCVQCQVFTTYEEDAPEL